MNQTTYEKLLESIKDLSEEECAEVMDFVLSLQTQQNK